MKSEWTIESAIEQIKSCGFECVGGKLENNQAWRWLQHRARALSAVTEAIFEMAPKEEPVYELTHNSGDDQTFGVNVAYWSIAKQIRDSVEGSAANQQSIMAETNRCAEIAESLNAPNVADAIRMGAVVELVEPAKRTPGA